MVVFESHHLAFRAKSALKQAKIPWSFSLVPAPRRLSVSCHYAIQVPVDRLADTQAALAAAGLDEGLSYHQVEVRR
jgi:hypothetical protein